MKNKGFKILFGIYIFMFLADLATTLMNWGLLEYLEANPLFKWGGLPLLIFINIAYAGLLWWLYNKKKYNSTARFFVMMVMMGVIITRVFVCINNWLIAQNPPTLAEAQALTTAVKTQMYMIAVTPMAFGMVQGFVAWLFFRMDHKVEQKC